MITPEGAWIVPNLIVVLLQMYAYTLILKIMVRVLVEGGGADSYSYCSSLLSWSSVCLVEHELTVTGYL